ncbi:hypothetical protein TRAPUB_6574 [Trametes pubescens]|uniref:CCZ1/INTU/HSP4 first Longin domain-containing protein n=1 Tax=Trametes pubescens TaxID=154538 RepID=A0A1M2V5Q8_TRAPU|nr:hypothetical protein TRAPUB_6574 [Trametes pubescens]
MFNASVPCENVHSQARRMIMLSPEPNFWIHACFEVAKTPRPPPATSKAKETSKSKHKGKEKERAPRPPVQYDYHDGSVHDEALRTHFQRGYEGFKLLHGSFTSVLSTLGQQALELQLERFFTIWAWKWDIEDEDFGSHLGIPLHPLHARLTPLLESFASTLPQELTTLALIPPYVIPPRSPRYPPALVHYVFSRIPPPPTPVSRNNSSGTGASSVPSSVPPVVPDKPAAPTSSGIVKLAPNPDLVSTMTNSLLVMPNIPSMPSMNLGLDAKNFKWNWPGYLTFGKSGANSRPSSIPQTPTAVAAENGGSSQAQIPPGKHEGEEALKPDGGAGGKGLDVDTASLLEAISTESMGSYTRAASPTPSALSRSSQLGDTSTHDFTEHLSPVQSTKSPVLEDGDTVEASGVSSVPPSDPLPPTTPRVSRSFLGSSVYLASPGDPLATERKRVLHLTQDEYTVAVVLDMDHTLDLAQLADNAVELIESLSQAAEEGDLRVKDIQIPSATKILQPKDKYVIASDEYTTTSSAGFNSRSEHLYDGQELLRRSVCVLAYNTSNLTRKLSSDHDVLEVFSRGQNPQHWYIGKRGLGTAADGRAVEGEAYMEVSRKETTLTDVDNELAGVVRRFIEHL